MFLKENQGKMHHKRMLLAVISLVTFLFLFAPTINAAHWSFTDKRIAPAQSRFSKASFQAALTPTPTPASVNSNKASITPTITPTLTITRNVEITAPLSAITDVISSTLPFTPTESITTTNPPEGATAPETNDAKYAAPVDGTIIANRTDAKVRFFVEGATYDLDPARAFGVALPRETAVLNLYNCDLDKPAEQTNCYWDPYLLDRDGFYEIVRGAEAGQALNLTLQAAGSPPTNQIWLQNRSSRRELIFYQGETYELPPSAIREFATEDDTPAVLFLRSCLAITDRTICEWTPADAKPGFYYALIEVSSAGALPGSRVETVELRPIVSQEGETVETPAQVVCRLQVPTINVRSGPGLEYEIINKVRGTAEQPATVLVVGRDTAGQWLAVDQRVAANGWVTGSPNFVICNGDINALPVVEAVNARLAATPTAASAVGAPTATPAASQPAAAPTEPAQATPTLPPPGPSIPEGLALIVVNNGFDQVIRFTLDQRFRVEAGPSEYDLQPGESRSFLVFPGQIAFTSSTPWRGLSDNAEFTLGPNESRVLWIVFIPDPDGSGRWVLQY